MTTSTNAMALFCEDIREELNGVFTLVGLLPDNVNVNAVMPGGEDTSGGEIKVLGKLCVFIRINFAPERRPNDIKLKLLIGSEEHDIGRVEKKTIDEAVQKAVERGNQLAGVISRAIFGGFNFERAAGQLKVNAIIDDEVYLAGALTINLKSDKIEAVTTTDPNASQLPS